MNDLDNELFCSNLLTEKENELFCKHLLRKNAGTWYNLKTILTTDKSESNFGLFQDLFVIWLHEPDLNDENVIIIFYDVKSSWLFTATYNKSRLFRE